VKSFYFYTNPIQRPCPDADEAMALFKHGLDSPDRMYEIVISLKFSNLSQCILMKSTGLKNCPDSVYLLKNISHSKDRSGNRWKAPCRRQGHWSRSGALPINCLSLFFLESWRLSVCVDSGADCLSSLASVVCFRSDTVHSGSLHGGPLPQSKARR
jgi:hypothetical protein